MATSQCPLLSIILLPGGWGHQGSSGTPTLWEIPCPLNSAGETLRNYLSHRRISWNLNSPLILGWPIARAITEGAAELLPQDSRGSICNCGDIWKQFHPHDGFVLLLQHLPLKFWSKTSSLAEPAWFPSLLQCNYSCCAAILALLYQKTVLAGKENTCVHLYCLNYSFILFHSRLNKECQRSPDCLYGSCI